MVVTIPAVVVVSTRFVASTRPTPADPAPPAVELSIPAVTCAPRRSASGSVPPASTRSAPSALNRVSVILATVATAASVPIEVPRSALAPSEKISVDDQPTLLKASVTPTAVPAAASAAIAFVAVIPVSVSARTSRPPPETISPRVTVALAPPRTELLAISPPKAMPPLSSSPSAGVAPSSSSASAILTEPVAVASIVAVPMADRTKSPPDTTDMSVSDASTPPRTSLRTTSPPTAVVPSAESSVSAVMVALSLARTATDPPAIRPFG